MVSLIQPFEKLAIVGMDAAWAGCDGLEAFERMVYEMRQHSLSQFAQAESGRISGSLTAVEPLLGKVTRRALLDAGVNIEISPVRIAVLACNGGVLNNAPEQKQWKWASSFQDF
ncbi:MAG: hypothetical protein EHM21_01155, partial [Chloroflexi bacterium]